MRHTEIIRLAKEILAEVKEVRRAIHCDPELSFEEYNTCGLICSALEKEKIPYRIIAGTGVLAEIRGANGNAGDTVVLRADMDALPIEEATGLRYASRNKGVMHACGHDMHTSGLLGALFILNRCREQIKGTVLGLFQPGEELWPGGATKVLQEKPFEGYDIRAFVGQHVDPELPTGTFGFRAGKYMASTDELHITINGEGGHAAMPHRLKDPIVAAAAAISALQQVTSRNVNPAIPTVLSIGRVVADGATNVIPDKVEMEGTFRTFDETWRAEAKQRIRSIITSTAEAYGTTAEVRILDGYPCVYNNEEITSKSIETVREVFGTESVRMLDVRTTAEDFGYYTAVYPSLFYRLGVGGSGNYDAGKLHTSVFDPDENALQYAAAALAALALDL